MSTKPKAPSAAHSPSPPALRWRIVRDDEVLGSYESEVLARRRWRTIMRKVAGHGVKFVNPDGKVES